MLDCCQSGSTWTSGLASAQQQSNRPSINRAGAISVVSRRDILSASCSADVRAVQGCGKNLHPPSAK